MHSNLGGCQLCETSHGGQTLRDPTSGVEVTPVWSPAVIAGAEGDWLSHRCSCVPLAYGLYRHLEPLQETLCDSQYSWHQ